MGHNGSASGAGRGGAGRARSLHVVNSLDVRCGGMTSAALGITCVALLPKTDADKSKVQPDESLLIILPNRLKLLVLGET